MADAPSYTPTQNGSFGQRLQQPQQYAAHPVVSMTPAQTSTGDFHIPDMDEAEHMLRRKTPNGTLAAGYDSRSSESATRSHATKHILIPASHTRKPMHCPEAQVPEQLLQECQNHRLSSAAHPRQGLEQFTNREYGIGRAPEKRPLSCDGAGVDSVLNQGFTLQHSQVYENSHEVPTVLQPMWPPCPGFASMNCSGPYGPYWPDGAFEPYRPAPLRDPRYDHQPRGTASDLTYPRKPGTMQNQTWSYDRSIHQQPYPQVLTPLYQPSFKNMKLSPLRAQRQPPNDRDRILGISQDQPLGHEAIPEYSGRDYLDKHAGGSEPVDVPSASLEGLNRNSNTQFKERVLVWAHRTYIRLLASIHRSRRIESVEHDLDERKFPSNIYPKPPGQPSFQSAARTDFEQEFRLLHGVQCTEARIMDTDLNVLHSSDSRFSKCLPAHSRFIQQSHGTLSRPTNPKWQLRKYQDQSERSLQHQGRSLNNVSDDSSALLSHHEVSPMTTALSALEILSKLCHESGWRWTDGMLLGGCLAYGLGDHNRAMKWYSKVLACDPDNAEALSNLAATCLSLNRREDAERHWRQSVALRPSYFEAVEHLVGLFCEDRRGREAVKIIDFVQRALQSRSASVAFGSSVCGVDSASEGSLSPDTGLSERSDFEVSDCEVYGIRKRTHVSSRCSRSGSSGYDIPTCDNGRMLALIHGKGNMLYALGDNAGAAKAFEDAILIGSGQCHLGIRGLIKKVMRVFTGRTSIGRPGPQVSSTIDDPILLVPDEAINTAKLVFPPDGHLPGLLDVVGDAPQKAVCSIVSNSLLSLAKIYQDGMSSSAATAAGLRATSRVQDILALYYLSLSLQPSPSTANNVGILLASIQQATPIFKSTESNRTGITNVPGVVPGSGIALALAYYNYGLKLDPRHAHLYTNLGSLFKDIGQLDAAIKMYEKAVECDGKFDIALANLANAVKDRGRIGDAISYYKQAVTLNPDFAEAVCGLANALNSVCNWSGRGGVKFPGALRDRWHVDDHGMLYDAKHFRVSNAGWIGRVVAIVDKQLREGECWGKGVFPNFDIQGLFGQAVSPSSQRETNSADVGLIRKRLQNWAEEPWEGVKLVRLVERATKRLAWQFYRRKYVQRQRCQIADYSRPQLPLTLAIPSAPTVLPFHTFTCPLTAKQIRRISQRNGLRISCSTLRAPWLPAKIYEPPAPPQPHLNVGYVSSDFNNHPLAHLMQSVFGFHNRQRVKAFCYATTASDGSVHRQQIEREAPVFEDASSWSIDRLVDRIVSDGIHILINLNGYTRGARNEVFAARPAPVQMSFMGFAGTLGAEWCDYLLADKIAVPSQTLRPQRRNVDLLDQTKDGNNDDDQADWVYGENIIFARDTFFCCDHRQSAPDAKGPPLSWEEEQKRRWKMRKELFPGISDDTVILGNFNQLYKIEPTTFRTWLRILSRLPNCILWLLRFPDMGESNLKQTALRWVGSEVASRIIFTDVAPKSQHIARARVCDLFLDTPECNAHTTAADVLWSGTPLLTLPRYEYKMCSRMAASILTGALPKNTQGKRAARELIARSDEEYEERAVELGAGLMYPVRTGSVGFGSGRLVELRRLLYESRTSSALFDTRRWVRDLEDAYDEAWRRWVEGAGGDILL